MAGKKRSGRVEVDGTTPCPEREVKWRPDGRPDIQHPPEHIEVIKSLISQRDNLNAYLAGEAGLNTVVETLVVPGAINIQMALPLAPVVDLNKVHFDSTTYEGLTLSQIEVVEKLRAGRGEYVALTGIHHLNDRVIPGLPEPIQAIIEQAGERGKRRFNPLMVRFDD